MLGEWLKMTKYHINIHGVPAPCKAEKGKCPRGGASGEDNHFGSLKEAEEFIQNDLSEKHGTIPGLGSNYERMDSEVGRIHDELAEEIDELPDYELPENTDYKMYTQLDKYAKALQDKHDGKDVDLEKVRRDLSQTWINEVEIRGRSGDYAYESPDGSAVYGSKYKRYESEDYEADLEKADEAGEAFYERTEAINNAYNKLISTDWESLGSTKKEAVEHSLYNISGVFD